MTFTKEQLTRIIESADEVITALAGTNDDIHPDNSTKMCAAWDDLNDRNAPPSVVKKLAELALAGMEAEPVACPKCNDTGMADSGGVQPWGDEIMIPCDCSLPDPELTLLVHDLNIDGNHRLANVIQDLIEVKKAAPQPLTTYERAELENYRNAQQVVFGEMTPEMMRAVQLNSELGSYAAENMSGAYALFAEFWRVASNAAPQSGAVKDVLPEPIKDTHLNSGPDADDYYSGYQEGWNECLETISTGKQEAK